MGFGVPLLALGSPPCGFGAPYVRVGPAERAVTAGHDVSDGGLLSCALEMAFAGNCGLSLRFSTAGADSDRTG